MIKIAKGLKVKDIRSSIIPLVPSRTDGIKNLIINNLGDIDISQLKRHFCAVAVDIRRGNEIDFTSGNLANIVAGSCSVPGVFQPVKYGEYLLHDGGLANNIPSNVPKIVFDCDKVVAIDVNSTRGQGTESDKFFDTLLASMRIMMKSNSLKGYLNGDIVIQPDLKRFKSTKLDFVDEMIMEGYNAAIFEMDSIKNLINGKVVKEKIRKFKVNKHMV